MTALLVVCAPVHAQRMDVPLRSAMYQRDLAIRAPISEFTAVADLEVSRSGNIYVLDPGEQRVVMLDSSGRRIRSFGSRGEGPGEFRGAGKLALRGDSLWIVDYALRRVTRFSLDGRNPRSFAINPVVPGASAPAGIGTNGVVVAVNQSDAATGRKSVLDESRALILHADFRGNISDTVLSVTEPNSTLWYNIRPADVGGGKIVGNVKAQQPFSSRTYWSMNPQGSGIIAVSEETRAIPGGSGAILLNSISLSGDTLQSRRLLYKRQVVTAMHVDAIIDSLSKPFKVKGNLRVQGDPEMIRDSVRVPAFWPGVSGVTTGSDGSIWIKRNGPEVRGSNSYWVLFSGEREACAVTLPQSFKLLRASRSTLWGWTRDADELPVVERLRAVQLC